MLIHFILSLTLPTRLIRDSKFEEVLSLFFEYPMTRSRSNILLCGQEQSKGILESEDSGNPRGLLLASALPQDFHCWSLDTE